MDKVEVSLFKLFFPIQSNVHALIFTTSLSGEIGTIVPIL